jgi:nitrogen fixation/metabolism regulation signal transduction histidine kinase
MVSKRLIARLAAQAVVFAGGALAFTAWRAGLPANALLAALVGAGAATWVLTRDDARRAPAAPAPEADTVRLDQERGRRTLQAFLDQAPTPLVTRTPDGTLTAVNRAARRLFHTDGVLADAAGALGEAVAQASPETRKTVRLAAGGLPRTYALSVADVTGAGGALRLAALTDIQAELQAAEAAALKALLQVLSHEIMNTLTPLASLAQSATDLLEDDGPDSLQLARESVAVIARRADGLHRFVEAYRQLARLPEPRPRMVSLTAIIEEAARLFASRWSDVHLVVEPPRPDVVIRLDPDLTAQALLNLLANAAEAALAGEAAPPSVRLGGRPSGEGCAITVEDSGRGVDAEVRAAIFQPFFTTRAEGSGIGLSLARQAIVSQGGQLILAPAEPGTGALFVIEL